MKIFNQEISKEMMPSYISPDKQPYHRFQSMQDILSMSLQTQPLQQMQAVGPQSMQVQQNNQWSNVK